MTQLSILTASEQKIFDQPPVLNNDERHVYFSRNVLAEILIDQSADEPAKCFCFVVYGPLFFGLKICKRVQQNFQSVLFAVHKKSGDAPFGQCLIVTGRKKHQRTQVVTDDENSASDFMVGEPQPPANFFSQGRTGFFMAYEMDIA